MKRKSLCIALIASLSVCLPTKNLEAQDAHFTQFYANPLYLNPALTGVNRCPRVHLNYRNQWPALSGTFVTTSASYDQEVDGVGGIGILVLNDRAGKATLNTNRVSLIYSKSLEVNRYFTVRMGFQATYFQKTLDWNKLRFGDMIDPKRGFIYQTGDVPRGGSVGNMDFSTGVVGYTDNFYFGFAAHHLTEPDESLIQSTEGSPLPRKYTAHMGATIPLQGQTFANDVEISPNIMYRRQLKAEELNIGMYVTKGALTAGFWYRKKDAFIVSLGVQSETFRFGYSYDVTVSKLTNASAGSHEVSIGMNFACKEPKRGYRMINCPGF